MSHTPPVIVLIGAGPAGLMAAEQLLDQGWSVQMFDAMPSVGRKFLLAGRGGLNLTHSEDADSFVARYGADAVWIQGWLPHMDGPAVRQWAQELGIETFVGSSGRVFPVGMKAAPLLRAWLKRLYHKGLVLHTQHRWQGWDATGALVFDAPTAQSTLRADAVLLALGGASWARLGSDGRWLPWLQAAGVTTAPFVASNCGFRCRWSEYFSAHYAGTPIKTVAVRVGDHTPWRRGEVMVDQYGLEGGLVYAHSAALRQQWQQHGVAQLQLDLLPDWSLEKLALTLQQPRGARSWSSFLGQKVKLKGVKLALLHECLSPDVWEQPATLASHIKQLSISFNEPAPMDRAISTVGGVTRSALTDDLMLHALPGVFCAGEMMDWDAPTGGYLLTACLASGHVAAKGMTAYLRAQGFAPTPIASAESSRSS